MEWRVGYEIDGEEYEGAGAGEGADDEARARFAAERGSPYRGAAIRVDLDQMEEEVSVTEDAEPGHLRNSLL